MDDNMHTSVRDRVLDSIAEQGIAPKPRWHFLLREWVVWTVAFGAFVVGSIATALSIYIATTSRFMEDAIEFSRLDTVFEAVPLVWMVLVSVALSYAVYAVRETVRGYRYHRGWLILCAVIASTVMGTLLYAQGMGAAIDRYLLTELPVYRPMSGFQPRHWMHPHEGVIAGVVVEADDAGYTIRSLDGTDVEVVRSTSTVITCPHGEQTIGEGVHVRIMGTSTGERTYEAYAICEFRGRGVPPRQNRVAW